jgi:hypothetical protein
MALTLDEIKAKVEEQRINNIRMNTAAEQFKYDKTIAKKDLVVGEYYLGDCRNAQIARWDGNMFYHWRTKFGTKFIEAIKHPEDEQYYDVFYPFELYELHEDDIGVTFETDKK